MSETADIEVRRERAARNQALFREVNERIEELSRPAYSRAFICECCDETCHETLSITIGEYEQMRSDGNRFAVLPGHELLEVEEIVEANERYFIVAKLGSGGTLAERLDPRSRDLP
jgi:hypothetical protein